MNHRTLLLFASLVSGLAAPAAARLFYQTYGATVPAADGCAWNAGQDFFVPRTCASCRYGLWSGCHASHTTSAACRNASALHPGYCSPYGPCRDRWRDHVYKSHCGCTPLRLAHGCWSSPLGPSGCSHEAGLAIGGCGGGECYASLASADCGFGPIGNGMAHVEPAGGVSLGQMPATSFASSFMGAGGAGGGGMGGGMMGGGMGGGMMGGGMMPGMMPGMNGAMPGMPGMMGAPMQQAPAPTLPLIPAQPMTLPSTIPGLSTGS